MAYVRPEHLHTTNLDWLVLQVQLSQFFFEVAKSRARANIIRSLVYAHAARHSGRADRCDFGRL